MEFVYVVPRKALFPDFYPLGLVPFADVETPSPERIPVGAFESTVVREGFFVEREWAERQPEFKQVIPYSVVECDGKVLLLRRLSGGGEARLRGKLSIGIGGHINPEDLPQESQGRGKRSPIDAGTRREVEEELAIDGRWEVRRFGILNDDSNPVGAVHVGVVQCITVHGSVEIRERDQLEGRLVDPDELRARLEEGAEFETWSSLLVPHLDEILTTAAASGAPRS